MASEKRYEEIKRKILYDFNDTAVPYPSESTIHELFEEQVNNTPDNVAVVQGDLQITYRELDQRANRIANYLTGQFPDKSEQIVAVLQEQSVNMIISIIGILKAGCAFLTMDPVLPEQALKHMLVEAGSEVVISTRDHTGLLNRLQWECHKFKVFICLDSNDIHEETEEKDNILMDKKLWDYVGEESESSLGRGGWKNSFTGELFSLEEIDEYSKNIEEKLKPYINKDTRILEIGCASGFTMFQLAPLAGFYYGTDLSEVILEKTAKEVREGEYDNIRLKSLAAHDIDKLDEKDFDIVILNSVIQAFHGHNYFRRVIKKAIYLLKDKGIIFAGDVMDQSLKHDLEVDVTRFAVENRDMQYKTKTDFSDELFLAPGFFEDLSLEQSEIKGCKITGKIHSIKNELTEYRYDAILEVDKGFHGTKDRKKNKEQHGLNELEKYQDFIMKGRAKANSLAYVIFTSGSTGKPKGVMVEHRALVNMCSWYNSYHNINADDRSTKFANCGFDASIMEIFPILIKGGSIYILSQEIKSDLNRLNRFIEENKITICFLPTQYCEQFMELDNKTLRLVNTGGEKLKKYIKRSYTLVDNYGATECTVVSTFFKVDRQYGNIPVGKPVYNTRVYILDNNKRLLPPGEVGEIYIAGDSLARGYLNRPDLTGERFMSDPFFNGEMMYRTGDLAKWLTDGNMEFIGRIDNQVKIRGYRIEPGEIEGRLIEHPDVEQAVVTVYTRNNGEKCLCAYLILYKEIEIDGIKKFLAGRVPEYMVPEFFYKLDSMPLTSSGKIDKKALSKPEENMYNASDYKAPENDIEKGLAVIWQSVLGIPRVGTDDDFFNSGGHSLKVLKAAVEINNEFEIEISAAGLFKARTIREQAVLIGKCRKKHTDPIVTAENREFYPASSSQKRIYALQQMDPQNTAYNITFAFLFKGDVAVERLESAFFKVSSRHEVLRTEFDMYEGIVVQRVKDKPEIHVEYRELDLENTKKTDLIIKEFIKPFNLNNAPLFRIGLIRLNAGEYLFLLDIHHIILDGSSVEILWDEISKAYNGEDIEKPKVQYKDFAQWQIRELAEGRLDKQKKYWISQFDKEIPDLKLPLDYERMDTRSYEGDIYRFYINAEITGKLKKLAKGHSVSMNMLLMAAYNILISKYSGCDDIVTGTPVYGRSHPDLKGCIGMFANTIALRSRPSGEKRFTDYIMDMKQCILNAMENQDYPFEELVENVITTYDKSRNPLFDTMFVTQRFTDDNFNLDGITVERIKFIKPKAKFDQTWYAALNNDGIDIEIEYCTGLFKRESIIRASRHFGIIIEQILDDSKIKISDIEIITNEEKCKILNAFNCLKEYPAEEGTVSRVFEDMVRRYGNKTALAFNDETMSYEELNKRANQMAVYLGKNGAGRKVIVALSAVRSFEMVIGLLGIMKVGGVCLPINPDFPKEYINAVLEQGNVGLILEYSGFGGKRLDIDKDRYKILDMNNPEIQRENTDNITCGSSPSDLLYVVYTSGTTGKPKGVMIDNWSFLNLMNHQKFNSNLDFSGVLQFASITFDVSFQEIFSALLSGGELLLVSENDKTDILMLFSLIEGRSIKTLFLPPAFLNFIFNEREYIDKFPKSVKHIVAAGEQLFVSKNLKEYLTENKVYLHNHYGPCETHVVTSLTLDYCEDIPGRPSIGTPIPNRRVFIMDKDRKLLPEGIPGELCIEIIDSACGYINQPDLAREKFIDNPISPGSRLYLTGDAAKWLNDGNIEFLGRLDQQIKIRGYRIEPSIIEGVLMNYRDIKNVLVMCHGEGSNKYLCCYIESDAVISTSDLRKYLNKQLPHYMIPSCFKVLKSFPVNPSGKIDRSALPYPGIADEPESDFAEGSDYGKLANIWKEVLETEKVSVDDDFFELGGHSLKVLKAVVEINKVFNVRISASQLFKAKTIKEQVLLIEKKENTGFIPMNNTATKGFYPASSAQKRIYAIENMNAGSTAYNMPFAYFIKGDLCTGNLRSAFKRLVKKHEILRTDFHIVNGAVMQRVINADDAILKFKESDFRDFEWSKSAAGNNVINSGPKEGNCINIINEFDMDKIMEGFVKPFELEQGPLFRVEIIKLGNLEYLLLFDVHHIIMDGTSMEILWEELSKAYNGEDIGNLKVQYKDFTSWQINELTHGTLKEQEKYWLEQFGRKVPSIRLPLDYERPEIRNFEGDVYPFRLEGELTHKIQSFAKGNDVSVNMVLFAVYGILLAKCSGQEDIVVGTPVYGRNHGDITKAIGMFANTIAIRSYPAGDKHFADYIKEVREIFLNGMENQDYPFEELLEKADFNHSSGCNPLFDTVFVTQKFGIERFEFGGLDVLKLKTRYKKSKFDLSWFAEVNGDCIDFIIEYCTGIFKRDSIKRIAMEYEQIVGQLVRNPQMLIGKVRLSEKIAVSRKRNRMKRATTAHENYDSGNLPVNAVEKRLAGIWKDVLGVHEVGVNDNFFELGGHSLKAITLMYRVRKEFYRDIPVHVLFKYSTVRSLAGLIDDDTKIKDWTHIVGIKINNGHKNVFCIHPAPGTVICYYDLAKYIRGNWSVYALQSKGLENGQKPHGSIEEMAEAYIKEMKEIQKKGPYILIGWSAGGKIAYEIARQLNCMGEKVELLAMLDTDPVFLRENSLLCLISLFRYFLSAMLTHSNIFFKNLNITSPGLKTIVRRARMWLYLALAAIRYKPEPYNGNGKVVLFQTGEGRKIEEGLKDKSRSIGRFINELDISPVKGKHLDILSEPNVKDLCSKLNRYLNTIEETSDLFQAEFIED